MSVCLLIGSFSYRGVYTCLIPMFIHTCLQSRGVYIKCTYHSDLLCVQSIPVFASLIREYSTAAGVVAAIRKGELQVTS
jgi:hypothetical protein